MGTPVFMLEMFGYDKHVEELGRTNTLGRKFLSPGNWALHIVLDYYKTISVLLLIGFEFEY